MAPSKNPVLAGKIAHLKLELAPLVPLPVGPPHPSFPNTLLAYHLLTEEELDSIAHYYHQSTPGFWTYQYPACMNWDKEFLDVSNRRSSVGLVRRQSQTELQQCNEWWTEFVAPSHEDNVGCTSPKTGRRNSHGRRWSFTMSDKERIAIKRRKVGKFIGLVGMDTPLDEIEGRIQRSMEQAIKFAQEETKRIEDMVMRRSKLG